MLTCYSLKYYIEKSFEFKMTEKVLANYETQRQSLNETDTIAKVIIQSKYSPHDVYISSDEIIAVEN